MLTLISQSSTRKNDEIILSRKNLVDFFSHLYGHIKKYTGETVVDSCVELIFAKLMRERLSEQRE